CRGRRRQLSGLARGAPRRAGDPYRLSRRPRVTVTGTYRHLGAVSEGRTPRETMLPRVPSSQTKRWRAAMLLPHSNPTQIFAGQNRVKVKTPLSQDKTLPSVKPWRKGGTRFAIVSSLICGPSGSNVVNSRLFFPTARYRVLTLDIQSSLRITPRRHSSGNGGGTRVLHRPTRGCRCRRCH